MCPYLCVGLCWTLTCSSCETTKLFLMSHTGTGRARWCSLGIRRLQHRNLALDLTLGRALQWQLARALVQLGCSGGCAQVWPILRRWGEDCRLGELSSGGKLRMADLGLRGNLLQRTNKNNTLLFYYVIIRDNDVLLKVFYSTWLKYSMCQQRCRPFFHLDHQINLHANKDVKTTWQNITIKDSSSQSHPLGKHLHCTAGFIITCIRGWVLPFVGGCVFWDGPVCVYKGWVVSADMNAGCEWEVSDLTLCCRAAEGWCCGDVGPTLPSTGEGNGMRDTGMGETNMFSVCIGEMGETEGVTGRVCPGERKMWLRVEEVEGWGAVHEWG